MRKRTESLISGKAKFLEWNLAVDDCGIGVDGGGKSTLDLFFFNKEDY